MHVQERINILNFQLSEMI